MYSDYAAGCTAVESRHIFFSSPHRQDRFKIQGVLKLSTKKPSEHDTPSTWAPSSTHGMSKIYSYSSRAFCSMSNSIDPVVSVLYFKTSYVVYRNLVDTVIHMFSSEKSLIVMSGELAGWWDGTSTTNPSVLQGDIRASEWRYTVFLEKNDMVQYLKLLMSSTGIWWKPSFTCSHRKNLWLWCSLSWTSDEMGPPRQVHEYCKGTVDLQSDVTPSFLKKIACCSTWSCGYTKFPSIFR